MTESAEVVTVAENPAPAPQEAPAAPAALERFEEEHGSSALLTFVRDLGLAYEAARRLVVTSFVPQSYSGKPQEAAAAIVAGAEMGLSPLAALRSIDIIQGVPAVRAVALRAMVQSRGHEIWVEDSNSQRAIVKGRRKGSDNIETSVWDMERARGLKLTGKDNWQKQPGAMLVARATSECARLIAADVLLGVPYTSEELEDGAEVEAPKPSAPAAQGRVVRRKPVTPPPASTDRDHVPGDEEPQSAAVATVGPVTVNPGEGDGLGLTPEEAAEYGVTP